TQGIWNFPSKKRVPAIVLERKKEMDCFLRFIDRDPVIQEFLRKDTCYILADRYLLAMIFMYFKRAGYKVQDFTSYSFFVALFIALDIEEDYNFKNELYSWALGYHWRERYKELQKSRNALWKAMDYRAIVSRAQCEKVISLRPHHYIWRRIRSPLYAGAKRP
ncbi:hypothetical protein B7P43_G02840, partial [Cryptotermes secundus]